MMSKCPRCQCNRFYNVFEITDGEGRHFKVPRQVGYICSECDREFPIQSKENVNNYFKEKTIMN